ARDGVLDRDQVARAGEDELERPRRVRLDVVAAQLQWIRRRRVRAGHGGERDVVARLAHEAEMYRLVVRLRALHVGERTNRPAQALLEPELRQRDRTRRLA